MKQGSLFCFVLFCHAENHGASCCALDIYGKLSMSGVGGAHCLGLRLFGVMVWKLLVVESFSQ
jgi:hypothetical protein